VLASVRILLHGLCLRVCCLAAGFAVVDGWMGCAGSGTARVAQEEKKGRKEGRVLW